MTNYNIPDITFLDSDNHSTFESSNNIICIQQIEEGCKVSFFDKPYRIIKQDIHQLGDVLVNKGMYNLNDRLLFRMRDVSKILKEDFLYHMFLNSKERIELNEEEANFIIERLVKI